MLILFCGIRVSEEIVQHPGKAVSGTGYLILDKGLGLLIGGFTPNMFESVTIYTPTVREIAVAIGVYAVGALVLSLLWKIALSIKFETGHNDGDLIK